MFLTKKFLFLNQMAGPLFRELAEDLSEEVSGVSELYTGHPDTLNKNNITNKLKITQSPIYDRTSKKTRILSWLKYTFLAFGKMLKVEKDTVVFIVSNPPLLGPLAWLICKLRGIPYIVLVYDMHPDTLISFGVLKDNSIPVKIWRYINRNVWENSLAVYTIGTVMAERLESQFQVTKTRLGEVGVIPPWADTDNIKPINKDCNPLAKELDQENCITVLYSGNMGVSHDIDSMLQAAKLLQNNRAIKFLFIGEGAKWQYAFDFVQNENLTNTQVLPFQPEERLPYTMALGDISLVALDKGAEGLMVPSKMYYYMAAGSAVIGICQGRNDLEESLKLGSSGKVVEPNNPVQLAEMINSLVNDPDLLLTLRNNSRISCVNNFSRKSCMMKFNNSIKTILNIGDA